MIGVGDGAGLRLAHGQGRAVGATVAGDDGGVGRPRWSHSRCSAGLAEVVLHARGHRGGRPRKAGSRPRLAPPLLLTTTLVTVSLAGVSVLVMAQDFVSPTARVT